MMKKTMMAVAALSATVAMAADIVSSDVVGYLNTTATKGTSYQGPTFVALGDGKLSDYKVTGYTGDVDGEMVTISKINAYGVNVKDVIWLDYPEAELYGWYQYDGESDPVDCNTDPLTAGECLMVQVQEGAVGWDVTSAGKVEMDGVAVTLVKGTQYLASAAPRDATMEEVIVSGYTGDVDGEVVTVSKLNAYGVNVKDIIWLDYPEAELYGWYQYDGESDPVDCNDDELKAGQGLMVQAQEGAVGWTLTFPPAAPSAD